MVEGQGGIAGGVAAGAEPAPSAGPDAQAKPGAPAGIENGVENKQAAEEIQKQLMEAIPPEMKDATMRVVEAGKRVMFDDKTHDKMMQKYQSIEESDPATKVAMAVASLMSIINDQLKGPVPPDAIIAGSGILLADAINFLADAGEFMETNELVAKATQDLMAFMMQKYDITPEKVAQAKGQGGAGGSETPPGAAAPNPGPEQGPGPGGPGLAGRV